MSSQFNGGKMTQIYSKTSAMQKIKGSQQRDHKIMQLSKASLEGESPETDLQGRTFQARGRAFQMPDVVMLLAFEGQGLLPPELADSQQ